MQVAGSGQAQTADTCSANATLSDVDARPLVDVAVEVESGRKPGNFLEVPQPARSSPAATAEEICRWESMVAEAVAERSAGAAMVECVQHLLKK